LRLIGNTATSLGRGFIMKKRSIILLLFVMLLVSCSSSQSSEAQLISERSVAQNSYVETDAASAPAPLAAASTEREVMASEDSAGSAGARGVRGPTDQAGDERSQSAVLNRKIIYNATLRLRVDDPRATAKSLEGLVAQYGGYVSYANIHETYDDVYQGNVQLRVDAEQFEAALDALRALATDVLTEQRDSQDVTAQFVDVTARIENLERTETELQELLTEAREKSRKVEDVLSVYRELTTIREQIEVYQGQLNVLGDQVSLATIDVELIPPEVEVEIVDDGWNPMRTVRSAMRNLTEGGQALVEFTIIFVLNILPCLLLVGLIGFGFLRLWGWLRKTSKKQVEPASKKPVSPVSASVNDTNDAG